MMRMTYKELRDIVVEAGNIEHPKYLSLINRIDHQINEYGRYSDVPLDSQLFDDADEVMDEVGD